MHGRLRPLQREMSLTLAVRGHDPVADAHQDTAKVKIERNRLPGVAVKHRVHASSCGLCQLPNDKFSTS